MQTMETEELKDVLSTGVDLVHYAEEVDQLLLRSEAVCLSEFELHAKEVGMFYNELCACDNMLLRMNDTLTNFQKHLGKICDEITGLSEKSMNINCYLLNRKNALIELDPKIQGVFLEPELVVKLWSMDVNEQFMAPLSELHTKLSDSLKNDSNIGPIKYEFDLLLQTLKDKVVLKLRTFLYKRFQSLRVMHTNIEIKQEVLLKCAFAFEFLIIHAPIIAEELQNYYCDSMSEEYCKQFRNYIGGLLALVSPSEVSSEDLIGSCTESFFRFGSSAEAHSLKVFQLAGREALISNFDADPALYHVYKSNSISLTFEELFRSALRLLCDTIVSEHSFFSKFFLASTSSPGKGALNKILQELFRMTNSYFKLELEKYLATSYDIIAILLMIKMVQLQSSRSYITSWFCDSVLMMLWPAFKVCMDRHTQSVRVLMPSKLSTVNYARPQTEVLGRYLELIHSFSIIHDIGSFSAMDETISWSELSLLTEIENYVMRISHAIDNAKLQGVFLIHNYEHLLTFMTVRNINSDCTVRISELLQSQVVLFVEEELMDPGNHPCFSQFISFLKSVEVSLSINPHYEIEQQGAELVLADFSVSWKEAIRSLIENVNNYFDPAKEVVSEQVLKQTLAQLLLYYQRFHELMKNSFRDVSFIKDLIPLHSVMFEIKKYVHKF